MKHTEQKLKEFFISNRDAIHFKDTQKELGYVTRLNPISVEDKKKHPRMRYTVHYKKSFPNKIQSSPKKKSKSIESIYNNIVKEFNRNGLKTSGTGYYVNPPNSSGHIGGVRFDSDTRMTWHIGLEDGRKAGLSYKYWSEGGDDFHTIKNQEILHLKIKKIFDRERLQVTKIYIGTQQTYWDYEVTYVIETKRKLRPA